MRMLGDDLLPAEGHDAACNQCQIKEGLNLANDHPHCSVDAAKLPTELLARTTPPAANRDTSFTRN